ncbi:MAG: DUF2800 domain-containing protein [Methylocella sp.]
MPALLPEHSPLGGSSIERWSRCPGSVALIEALGPDDDEDPDYRRDGLQAHAIGAYCLENDKEIWEVPLDHVPDLTGDMLKAVQVYLAYVRQLPSRIRYIEYKMYAPELHKQAFGTGDYISVGVAENGVDFVDYKHGEGIVINVVGNKQLMYYAALYLAQHPEVADTEAIRLHIVQPRAEHPDGPCRMWATTAFEIRGWTKNYLRPALERTAVDRYLEVGEHCRFCPVLKALACPAHAIRADELHRKLSTHDNPEQRLQALDNDALDDWYGKWTWLRMMGKKIEDEMYKRVLAGAVMQNAKAVKKITDRAWKPEAPVSETFSEEAFTAPKLKSPAQIAALNGGKEFVAEWAFSPDGGLTVAPTSDRRAAVTVQSDDEKYTAFLPKALDAVQEPV